MECESARSSTAKNQSEWYQKCPRRTRTSRAAVASGQVSRAGAPIDCQASPGSAVRRSVPAANLAQSV
ncbi:uncharacterized protein TRAVEDRAFT_54658 [Trametes versicolor FP-101664 SS1]|uniref:Uncharacterized protein n=1 Tax=Trametes versicolor (strain FP-101664) TaxID=717944 RepID=R7S6X6_TRAVS|nr:uncharacterized protein TRAVEDRAFT_54658 [Trametes versicolor FP-101664 SS1]EIW51327.1 hypothetical protein TRAVEDRAFT_54658 [Trametes versicolor FP-101664 SS1]